MGMIAGEPDLFPVVGLVVVEGDVGEPVDERAALTEATVPMTRGCLSMAVVEVDLVGLADVEFEDVLGLVGVEGGVEGPGDEDLVHVVAGVEDSEDESAAKMFSSMKSPRHGDLGIGLPLAGPRRSRVFVEGRLGATVVKPSASVTLKHAWMVSRRSSMAWNRGPGCLSGQSRDACPFLPQPQHSLSATLTGAAVHLPGCSLLQLRHFLGPRGPGVAGEDLPGALVRCDEGAPPPPGRRPGNRRPLPFGMRWIAARSSVSLPSSRKRCAAAMRSSKSMNSLSSPSSPHSSSSTAWMGSFLRFMRTRPAWVRTWLRNRS